MIRIFLSFLFISIFISCGEKETTEFVEIKNGDVVIESYTRRKSDFAKQGTFSRFSPTGILMEKSEYKNDTLHGKQQFFYPSGQVQEFVHYKNGIHDGEYKTFFEDGKTEQEGTYLNGGLDGELQVYFVSGQLKEKLFYKKNQEIGPFVEYHENGHVKTEGTYNGADPDTNIALEHGELKKYDKNGEHYQTMNCNNGRCSTTWKKDGVDIQID